MTTATDLAAMAEKVDWIVHEMNEAREQRSQMMETQLGLVRDVNEMKPAVQRWSRAENKAIGAVMVLSFIGAIAWTGVLFFKETLMEFFAK
jgi:hypothetical protein